MASFVPNQEVKTEEPTVEVTVSPEQPLPPGRHRFRLEVVDDSGNVSEPSVVEVLVIDDVRPTAVLDAPASVPFGRSFKLSGSRSRDLPPGKIVSYRWVLLA